MAAEGAEPRMQTEETGAGENTADEEMDGQAGDGSGGGNAEGETENVSSEDNVAVMNNSGGSNNGNSAANEGGGKKSHNRNAGRGSRRHAPYNAKGPAGSGHRAVYQQESADSDRSCRVYVGNLSWDVTWRELKDHMKSSGCDVTRADVLASPDGRSKGCGIVEFSTAEEAQKAVDTLNDTELMGRQIFVREDREDGSGGGYYTQQPGQSGGSSSTGRFATSEDAQNRRVYVGNLSWDVAWQDLKDHMRQAGEVVHAEVMTEADGRSKGCGIVEFAALDEAKEAIATLTDTELKGRMIFVREDREGGSGGGANPSGSGASGGFRGNRNASTSVYVGNLAYETSWQDLKDHMRAAGNVDSANILTSEEGRSKGCGIVQYQRPQDAGRAIRELQNSVLHGRPIFVREDRESGGRDGGSGGGRDGGGGGSTSVPQSAGGSGCQLFVGNLSFDTSWKELKDHFRQCGDVERAEVMEGPDGRKKGFGTVRFAKQKDASNAIRRLNGVELQGRKLEVRLDHKAN